MSHEIQAALTEMENCFQLLRPDPFDLTVNDVEITGWKTAEVDDCSSAQVANQQATFLEQMDSEQPCCSKDLPSVSLVPEAGSRSLEEEQEGREECLTSKLTSVGSDVSDEYETFVRSYGLGSHNYSLNLEISTGI